MDRDTPAEQVIWEMLTWFAFYVVIIALVVDLAR